MRRNIPVSSQKHCRGPGCKERLWMICATNPFGLTPGASQTSGRCWICSTTDPKTQSRQQIPQRSPDNLFLASKKATREIPSLKYHLSQAVQKARQRGSCWCWRDVPSHVSALQASHHEPVPREVQLEEGQGWLRSAAHHSMDGTTVTLPPSRDSRRTQTALPRTASSCKQI